jgi:hypothetical protein
VTARAGASRVVAGALAARAVESGLPPARDEREAAAILVRRRGKSIEVALELASRSPPTPRRELVLLSHDLVPSLPVSLAFFVPSPFGAPGPPFCALLLEVSRPLAASDVETRFHALASARGDLAAEAAREARARRSQPAAEERAPLDVRQAVRLLESDPRGGLSWVASRERAAAALDAAVSADEKTVAAIASSVTVALRMRLRRDAQAAALGDIAGGGLGSARSVPVEVELAAVRTLLAGGRPEGRALVARAHGAAFGQPRTLVLARVARDSRELDLLVVRANLIALESPVPEDRVAATLALAARGLDVPSPLAPPAVRHAVADRLWSEVFPREARQP